MRHELATGEHVVEPITDRGVVVERQHDRFGQCGCELVAVALGEAADRDHLAAAGLIG